MEMFSPGTVDLIDPPIKKPYLEVTFKLECEFQGIT